MDFQPFALIESTGKRTMEASYCSRNALQAIAAITGMKIEASPSSSIREVQNPASPLFELLEHHG